MMLHDEDLNHIESLIEQGMMTEVTMKNSSLIQDALTAVIKDIILLGILQPVGRCPLPAAR